MLLSQHCFDRAFNSIVDHHVMDTIMRVGASAAIFQFYSRSSDERKKEFEVEGVRKLSFNSIVDHQCATLDEIKEVIKSTFNSIVDHQLKETREKSYKISIDFQFYSRSSGLVHTPLPGL